jgi:hypothetical protein
MGVWKFEGHDGHVLEPTNKSWLHESKRWATRIKKFESFFSGFLNLAPRLRRVKFSIPHEAWRYHFFPIFFAKIRIHVDLHIHRWDFCVMKSEFTKLPSVMENVCTLLQCKVHLSMFHSSPTPKIWYIST